MSVEHILQDKGRNTITITGEQTLGAAADIMVAHRIGALVVTSGEGSVDGILSERDVVKAIAQRGADSLHHPVSEFMTTKVVTCTASASIGDLMGMMTEGKFRHIPVVAAGRLTGMVSIGDIVKHRLAEMEAEHKALRDYIATA